MTTQKVCIVCGDVFWAYSNQKFCSGKCRSQSRNKNIREKLPPRQDNFNKLLRYVEKNNLRPIFQKYKSAGVEQ
jgi:hypothetical protein